MTIAAVSGQNGKGLASPGTAASRAFGSNVATGSLIVVTAGKYSGSALSDPFVAGDCTKSAGTATLGTITLHSAVELDTSGSNDWESMAVWSAIVTSGGSCTMQVGGAASGSFILMTSHEFTGNWDATREEGTSTGSTATNGTTAADTGNATSAAAALFVAMMVSVDTSNSAITEDGAFTVIAEEEDATANQSGSGIYRIVGTGTTDSGSWTIPVTNTGWVAGVTVFKEGAGAPTINTHPQNATVYEGQTANFTVSATTSGGTLHYQWKDDAASVGTDSNSYTTAPTVIADNGAQITCDVSDDNGTTISNAATLTVIPTGRTAWLRA